MLCIPAVQKPNLNSGGSTAPCDTVLANERCVSDHFLMFCFSPLLRTNSHQGAIKALAVLNQFSRVGEGSVKVGPLF